MRILILILIIIPIMGYAQEYNFYEDFLWIKKTIEENDAGFRYAIEQKGIEAYTKHNEIIANQLRQGNRGLEGFELLYEWLKFFRKDHIDILPSDMNKFISIHKESLKKQNFDNWEKIELDVTDFKDYLINKSKDDIEGIWIYEPYKIGIKKQGKEYIGFIIEDRSEIWKKGQIKLRIPITKDKITYYMQDHSKKIFNEPEIIEKHLIRFNYVTFRKEYPKIEMNKSLKYYYDMITLSHPFIKKLNENTIILRIPSFSYLEKAKIDSLIKSNKDLLMTMDNLIIDLRNNGGGDDRSFKKLIPFIYTNPIRTIGTEFLSTPLNNKLRNWNTEDLEKLNSNIGKFVNLNDSIVSIIKLDTIYSKPKSVGIIINENNASTTEQFLLAAKQSKKVKLFGVTTAGVLDISNVHTVESPNKEIKLRYCLSRSMRIPEMTIDNKGIQPDYYIDETIPKYKWIEFVNRILNE